MAENKKLNEILKGVDLNKLELSSSGVLTLDGAPLAGRILAAGGPLSPDDINTGTCNVQCGAL